ncbi:hypothetical protein Tco_0210384 [Tanacetum coccineum]
MEKERCLKRNRSNEKYAKLAEAEAKSPLPSEAPATHVDMEAIAKKERTRLEELLKSKGMPYSSYPRFTVAVKGQKVRIWRCALGIGHRSIVLDAAHDTPMETVKPSWDKAVEMAYAKGAY